MNNSLYLTAMNMVRQDCEQCPHRFKASGKCPSERKTGQVGDLKTCTQSMYRHLLTHKPSTKSK